MMINQEYQNRIEGLAGEIAFNLIKTVAYQKLILIDDLEEEIDIYHDQEEEINYGELRYKTIEILRKQGHTIATAEEYAIIIGKKIAEEIHNTSKTHRILIKDIKDELDYHDYPNDIDDQDIINEAINALTNLDYIIIESEQQITPFPYHCTPNTIIEPFNENKYKNIKGIELEISDNSYKVEEVLADLVNDNIIATPDNWQNPFETPNIAIEEDSSVKYELIFRAQTNDKILKELEKIKNLETIVKNNTGTSAHIHINRAYIEEELGLTEIDIVKAAEFLNYPLFLISGRIKETTHEWAKSQLPCPIEANLTEKAKHVDRIKEILYRKHSLINCLPEDTIELRIFSNNCNFNKDTINMYLETVDFIIELSEYMKDKSYTKELKNIIPLCKKHFKKFGDTLDFYDTKEKILNEFKEPKTLLETIIKTTNTKQISIK